MVVVLSCVGVLLVYVGCVEIRVLRDDWLQCGAVEGSCISVLVSKCSTWVLLVMVVAADTVVPDGFWYD